MRGEYNGLILFSSAQPSPAGEGDFFLCLSYFLPSLYTTETKLTGFGLPVIRSPLPFNEAD
jgi:hypothetical protein